MCKRLTSGSHVLAVMLGTLGLGVMSSSVAEEGGLLLDWNIRGFNTYRADVYEDYGNLSASPYPNKGFQHFDDFTINMDRAFSPYENVRAQISGTVDNSEYRTQKEGLIFERGFVTWEKADVGIPFRAEMGDFFGNQTFRTLQRSLKGIQVELQPTMFNGKAHSIQLFSGITNVNYRDLSEDKDIFSGASWLLPESDFGSLLLTAVNNIKEADNTNPKLIQTVYSGAWGKEAEYFQQKLELEAEYSFLSGDVSGTELNKHDSGFFTQLKGKSNNIPLTYRLRHERYSDDFRPNGASITPNQRATELHMGWRFKSGLSMRARLQNFRTNWKSSNYMDRDVAGVTFSGMIIPALQITGSMGTFVSNSENEDNTTESLTHSSNASLSMPIADHWLARLGGLYTETDNRVSGQATVSRQVSFGVDHDFTIKGFKGAISPALVVRSNTTDRSETQFNLSPAVSLYLTKDAHNLSFSHNTQVQDSRIVNGIDTETHQSALNYSYTHKQHRFEAVANYFDRNPSPGEDTEAFRVGVAWTYNFDRPARPILKPAVEQQGLAAAQPAETVAAFNVQAGMMALAPGMDMDDVRGSLASSGIFDPVKRSGLEIYEFQMLETIDHRQRLGLLFSANVLDQSVLAIEFDDLGDIDSTSQIFDEVRKVLFNRYGVPINRIEEGEFSTNLSDDLRTGRFKRIYEWQTAAGILRFGIPHRTDGQVRMEIIHSRNFPSGENNFWSIETLR
jgi:hypothetical protein